MSDIELVIKRCKRLESLLGKHFAADGRGLHEKVTSVEHALPNPLVKRLRFIATVRKSSCTRKMPSSSKIAENTSKLATRRSWS